MKDSSHFLNLVESTLPLQLCALSDSVANLTLFFDRITSAFSLPTSNSNNHPCSFHSPLKE